MNLPRVDSTRNPLLGGQCFAVKLRNFVEKSFPSFFQGGETYLFINQLIIVVFVIKIFLKLMAMGQGGISD
jgi:hypothetical protein